MMKRMLLLGAIAAAMVVAPASAAPVNSVPLSVVTVGDRTCLHLDNATGAFTLNSWLGYKIADPAGAVFAEGTVFSWDAAAITWSCIPTATLAASGSGWTATVQIIRARGANGKTTLAFF